MRRTSPRTRMRMLAREKLGHEGQRLGFAAHRRKAHRLLRSETGNFFAREFDLVLIEPTFTHQTHEVAQECFGVRRIEPDRDRFEPEKMPAKFRHFEAVVMKQLQTL